MGIVSAYGIPVASFEEAFAVPQEVRSTWTAYVAAKVRFYEIVNTADGGWRWKLKPDATA